jgi:Flp pilus assembly protein TadG
MLLHRRRHGRGQTLVEFALILPVFLLVLFGILDLGRGVLAFNSIANGAREGARVAIVNQSMPQIRNRIVAKSTGVSIAPVADVRVAFRESTDPTVVTNVCRNPETGAQEPRPGCVAVVTVRTIFQPATPIIGNIIGPICMQSTTIMPIEAAPSPSPAPPPAWTAPCP